MPYITQERMAYMENDGDPGNAGELNYCLTWHLLHSPADFLYYALWDEVQRYMNLKVEAGNLHQRGKLNYALCNEIIGALECCRREYLRRRGTARGGLLRSDMVRATADRFYREVAAPYEDIKIQQNGDVYQ